MGRFLAIAAVAAALLAAQSATATDTPLLVVGFSKIGDFKVRGGNPRQANGIFGKPARVLETDTFCEEYWQGLRIGFYTLFEKKQCAPGTPFDSATISRPWVTDRGLRQGDTLAKAKRLYPSARKAKPGAKKVDLVVRLSQAIGPYGLTARVKSGPVTTLDIIDPQGGE